MLMLMTKCQYYLLQGYLKSAGCNVILSCYKTLPGWPKQQRDNNNQSERSLQTDTKNKMAAPFVLMIVFVSCEFLADFSPI